MTFKKGQSGNPDGRPVGTKNKWSKSLFEDLLKEMKKVEANEVVSKGQTILAHFVERAYESDSVLCSLMKKLVSDKKEVELEEESRVIVIGAEEPTEEEKAEWNKKAEEVRRGATEEANGDKEQEMEDFTDEEWLDFIKRKRANKEAREVNE